MAARDRDQVREQDAAFRSYVHEAAASNGGGTADELAKLANLRAQGVLTDVEFTEQNAKLLA
jgi:hypothetical protein